MKFQATFGNPQYWDISTSRYCSTHKSPEKCFKSSCDLPSLQASTCWARKLRNTVVVDPWPDMVHHMVPRNLDLHDIRSISNLDAVISRTKSLQSRQKHSYGYNTMQENDWHILTSECMFVYIYIYINNLRYSRYYISILDTILTYFHTLLPQMPYPHRSLKMYMTDHLCNKVEVDFLWVETM